MKKITILIIIIFFLVPVLIVNAESQKDILFGRIILQVEKNGEAWYLDPISEETIFLGKPYDAWLVMRSVGLGISNYDFDIFRGFAPRRLSGRILLQVEKNGEAWYVNPTDLKMHYLGRPYDAFQIMRSLGLGITNNDFDKLFVNKEEEIEQEVIFTSQAPFGEWSDERQQEGCEEASSLMAVKWARDEQFSLSDARDEILKISDFELGKYGQYVDTSAYDTLSRIIKDYFGYQKAELIKNIGKQQLISEIKKGKIIIAPTKGRELNNPNFTSPGPLIHMLLIKGYNGNDKEFITNDPGTRNGKSYRYDEDILFNAISDYVTAEHKLTDEKNVIAVYR